MRLARNQAAGGDQRVAPDPLTIRIPAAMTMLGLGRSKLYELMDDGIIATIKVGRSRLVVVESLRAFVTSRTHTERSSP
ncbi:helix-turn-helix domain-containing protein [uncultured Sphingomonas sp.]|uniref:helix-turn-helix domain-containing protein n=1 Tax=uncultured Sphingomonas sp. TaxID=158754 RepID=UPI0035CB0D2D